VYPGRNPDPRPGLSPCLDLTGTRKWIPTPKSDLDSYDLDLDLGFELDLYRLDLVIAADI